MTKTNYSDWQMNAKPAAKRVYADLLKTHGDKVGAAVEAMEIARRHAEIRQTEMEWRERHGLDDLHADLLNLECANLFGGLVGEFGAQRAVHILTGIEREQARAAWGNDLRAWRKQLNMTVADAALELGLAIEEIEAIEANTFSAGPEVMRLVRPALQRVRMDLGKLPAGQ